MEIREYLLAAVVAVPALGLSAGAGRAQEARLPDAQAPASSVMPSTGAPGTGGAPPNTGADTQSPAAGKTVPAESAKEGTSSAPIDTRVTVHHGKTPGKVTKSVGAVTKALREYLISKSTRTATPVVAGHTHVHDLRQPPFGSPAGKPPGAGGNAPTRNAIGAVVEHHLAADHDVAVPAGRSVLQSPATQSAATSASGMQAPVSATAAGLAAANQNHQALQFNPAVRVPPALSAGGPAINGTAMIRTGSSTGAVGGSPKAMAGVISGSNVRMKHP